MIPRKLPKNIVSPKAGQWLSHNGKKIGNRGVLAEGFRWWMEVFSFQRTVNCFWRFVYGAQGILNCQVPAKISGCS